MSLDTYRDFFKNEPKKYFSFWFNITGYKLHTGGIEIMCGIPTNTNFWASFHFSFNNQPAIMRLVNAIDRISRAKGTARGKGELEALTGCCFSILINKDGFDASAGAIDREEYLLCEDGSFIFDSMEVLKEELTQ